MGGSGEIVTSAAALAGGTGGFTVYQKTLSLSSDTDILYVTFSAQGDAHNGSALLMNASVAATPAGLVDPAALCEPLKGQTAGGGGGPHVQTGWYTLSHLPAATTGGVTNCNDGGGGPADCHDNTIYFSCCKRIGPHLDGTPGVVQIKLANLPGGDANFSFYERSTIYIDGQHDPSGALCAGVGIAPH